MPSFAPAAFSFRPRIVGGEPQMLRVLAALLLAALVTASARRPADCEGFTDPVLLSADHQIVTVPAFGGAPPSYVYHDLCQLDKDGACVFSAWVYEESNGVPGLQRDADGRAEGDCGQGARPDTHVL